jgi:hypothetical protein
MGQFEFVLKGHDFSRAVHPMALLPASAAEGSYFLF